MSNKNVKTPTHLPKLFQGCHRPLLEDKLPKSWPGHGSNGLGDSEFAKDDDYIAVEVDSTHAALALCALTRPTNAMTESDEKTATSFVGNPGKTDILALGPLTNLAVAIQLDRSFVQNTGLLYIMGGAVSGRGNSTPCSEFNFHSDPEAARIVLDAFGDKVHLVPWETCENAGLDWLHFDFLAKCHNSASLNARFFHKVNKSKY
jgi:inosine-uridine nucleoside N-ribohydrolase